MKQLYAFLASLKLAVILLVLLLLGLAGGTLIETRFGAELAGRLVYYAWWFLGLQALFALNLALSIADLFPWGQRRIGFMLVHASLILIFVGSAVTYFFKVEGNLMLWEGERGSVIEQGDSKGRLISRHQLPFEVELKDFRLDTYPGTMRPAGFSSQVVVTDLDTRRSFPAKIWMNHELHHRGYALFQSSYQEDNGREATVLAVSKDPGQNIVFVGFIALIVGMCVVLATRISQASALAKLTKGAMALLLVLGGLSLQAGANPELLRRLPVQHDGRTMPLDTLAREAVWTVTGSTKWKGQDPVVTLTEWLNDPKTAAHAPLLELGSKELVKELGLAPGTRHISFIGLVQTPPMIKLVQEARMAEMRGTPARKAVQEAMKLDKRFRTLKAVLFGEAIRPLPVIQDLNAAWNIPEEPTPENLVKLMEGPRLDGWPSAQKIDQEILYNKVNPARLSWLLLAASLVVAILAWVREHKLLDRLAFGLLIAGFGAMSWGIQLRWVAGDRIPAANMYESMLFLAWGVGAFAVLAYAVLKNRMVVINAAFMAALTMALCDLLPMDRFIHPIAPVLAGTPWLAIHVPIIMVGYAVLALGLVVAHMQVGVTIIRPHRLDLIEKMYDLNYWYTFVGSIFLIAGIITGSMWAASSWGRYWGWDPKEVWSLVAFLAYMAILHAKLDRQIGKFGVAAISIAAFQTILMTYLGVNFVLSTGMHSYGMGDSPIVMWMVIVALLEAAFLGWGLMAYRKNAQLLDLGNG